MIPDRLKMIIKKIKKLYSTHIIRKLLVTIVILGGILGLIRFIPIMGVKTGKLPAVEYAGLAAVGREITHEEGVVLVAETDSKRLYIDSATMSLKIEEISSGKVWTSSAAGSKEAMDQALLTISYLGEDNNLYEWDSYTYCTLIGSYTLHQIENGVQILLNVNEGESERFTEYYPQKMSPDRFENFFLGGLKNLVASGTLDQVTADKYQMTLELLYKKSIMEDSYAVSYNGTPPRSAVRQLIQLAKLLNYTRDMLIEDSEAMGLTVTFAEPAAFDIAVEVTLSGDDFVVRVPTQEMVSNNSYYTIQNIKVLPNFGAAAAADYEEGYIFVPDGAGALFEFNTFDPAVPEYRRPVYDNDYFTDYYFMPEYGEELFMPVFGMTYGKDAASTHGFLGIIERGAETSFIHAKLAASGKESTSFYNKAYASFDATQYSYVKVYGPYNNTDTSTYLADTGVMDVDYSIRYKLFGDTVTYYDMAMAYQNYLKESWNISEMNYPERAKLYLDFVGSVSLTERFLGIPYDKRFSMTTYRELADTVRDLEEVDFTLKYTGFFNGGYENQLYQGADLTRANGSKKELRELQELVKERGIKLFYDTALSKIYDEGNGFSPKFHAIYDYSNTPAVIFRYNPATGWFNYDFFEIYHNYLLSPRYLEGVTDKFMKEASGFDSLSISDLAYYNYPDYRFNNNISTYEASLVVEQSLRKLSSQKELSLYNPMMKYLNYGTYAEDISRESSNYATMYETIPFRQLVMNGLVNITTENVNMSSKNQSYYILQSVELGAYPKFSLTAKNVDVIKDSAYGYLYATEYAKQKEILLQVYSECKAVWDEIGTMEITGHTILMEKVYRTDYAQGASVITNYNMFPVVVDGKEIPAQGYLIIHE